MLFLKQSVSTLATIAVLVLSTHTETQSMQPCTPNLEPGITVTISDALTGSPLEANVILKDGNFQESLKVRGATPSGQTIYGGAFERPGKYTVSVAKSGYQTVVLRNVHVVQDKCHVKTQELSVELKRHTSQ